MVHPLLIVQTTIQNTKQRPCFWYQQRCMHCSKWFDALSNTCRNPFLFGRPTRRTWQFFLARWFHSLLHVNDVSLEESHFRPQGLARNDSTQNRLNNRLSPALSTLSPVALQQSQKVQTLRQIGCKMPSGPAAGCDIPTFLQLCPLAVDFHPPKMRRRGIVNGRPHRLQLCLMDLPSSLLILGGDHFVANQNPRLSSDPHAVRLLGTPFV